MNVLRAGLAVAVALSVSNGHTQEVQRPSRIAGDWCEYKVDGIGATSHRREVAEVAPDGGYTLKFVNGDALAELYVFNASDEMVGRNGREQKRIGTTAPAYPINAQSRGRVTKFSYPHIRRAGTTVEVTSEIKSVDSETVKVPAGTFDTLRVHTVANYRYADGTYSNQWVETTWHALDTKVRFPVRMEYIDYGARDSRRARELMRCGQS